MAQLAIGLGVGLGALLLLLIAAGVFLCKRNQVKRASTPVASSKALLDDCGEVVRVVIDDEVELREKLDAGHPVEPVQPVQPASRPDSADAVPASHANSTHVQDEDVVVADAALEAMRTSPIQPQFSHALSVSHKPIMRLMMLNTTPTAQLFEAYSERHSVSKGNFLRFISDFNVAPGWCTEAEATAVFAATNVSEAGDNDVNALDQEEFAEAIVRLGVYHNKSGVSTTDSSSDALAGAVMEFLEYLNANAPSSLQASTKFMLRKA